MPNCGKLYHEACARLNPLSVFDQRGLRCPLHTCLSCHLGCRSNGKATKGKATLWLCYATLGWGYARVGLGYARVRLGYAKVRLG